MSSPLDSALPQRLSSLDAEPALRFDAWRERAHQWVEMLPLPPGAELNAELITLKGSNCVLGAMRSFAYSMRAASRRLIHAPEMLVLTLIQAGEVLRDAAPGEPERMGQGSLGLYDPWRMGDYRWSQDSREVFLALPRTEVAAALEREPGNLLIASRQSALAPVLASHLEHAALLMQRPGVLDAAEYAGLLDATRELTLLMLRNLGRHSLDADDHPESLNTGRYTAAVRLMERDAHLHQLDAAAIAQGIGCSRTRLYAAFAAQGESVMETLREIRLQRARTLIEQAARLHIGSLSWRCGFTDQSSFSKLFKARFHSSPSEWHHRVWGRQPDESPAPTATKKTCARPRRAHAQEARAVAGACQSTSGQDQKR